MEAIIMTNNKNAQSQQEDIFSMFNLVDEHAEKLKKEEEARNLAKKKEIEAKVAKAKKAKPASKPAKKEEDKFTPDENTVIKYFGVDIPITQYFTPEELVEGLLVTRKGESERKPLEPEMLRKRMEKDYLELVKQFTAIIYLEKQNVIVVTMQARKKGVCRKGDVLSSDSTSLSTAKIPSSLLNEFISLAKLYGQHNLEVHGDIYYCTKQKKYFLDIPQQSVHRYWVEVTEEPYSIVERIQFAVKVLEIHSHHTMVPVPSAQDNESERVPGMHYAIVGQTNQFYPNVYLRQFVSEEFGHRRVELEDVFESPFNELPEFDVESIEVYQN